MSHFSNIILASSTNVFPIESDLSGNTVWSKALDFQKTRQIGLFGIFKELLSPHNVNVARFARVIEWDFLCDFQTPYSSLNILKVKEHEKNLHNFLKFSLN